MITFSDLPLKKSLQQALAKLGFTELTAIQAKTIPTLLEHSQDIHAQAETGTGKTLAFGLPLLQAINPSKKAVQGLIIAPTRELVCQIYESLHTVSKKTDVHIEPIYGGMPIDRQITAIKKGAHVIVGTPGRLNDHLKRKTLSLASLETLVLDEADIMLDMGFKDEIDSILAYTPEHRNIWLFSATIGPGIKKLIASHMHNVQTLHVAPTQKTTSQIKQYYCIASPRNRLASTIRFIQSAPDFYGIIFCRTKALTQEVMEKLASRGFRINCLHGDMKQSVRNQIIKGFKQKDFTILTATDVAARGIDVSDLTHVINYSLPEDRESYVHRIGRTGRAGKSGTAITLISPKEQYRIKQLEKIAGSTIQETSIPSVAHIITKKIATASDFIKQATKPIDATYSNVHTELQQLLTSFSDKEIRDALVIALENMFFTDIVHEEIASTHEEPHKHTQKELCIELGTNEQITEKMVRDHLLKTCIISPKDIYSIRVLHKRTYIRLNQTSIDTCLQKLRKKPLTEKKARVFTVNQQRSHKNERSRSQMERDKKHHVQDKKRKMRQRPK